MYVSFSLIQSYEVKVNNQTFTSFLKLLLQLLLIEYIKES